MKTKVYKFEELSPEAQEKALQDFSAINDEWWEFGYETIDTAAKLLGIEIDRKNGSPSISFSGFYSQGDYLNFSGYYSYAKGCKTAIKKKFPEDKKLAAIAANLIEAQKPLRYEGAARITAANRGGFRFLSDSEEIDDCITDFAHWAFSLLEAEYDYLTSREAIAESIEANEFEFEEDGTLA